MVDLKVDEVSKSTHKISISEHDVSIQKYEPIEDKSQNDDFITEGVNDDFTDNLHPSKRGKDFIINIGSKETGVISYHVRNKRSKLWRFSWSRMKLNQQSKQQKDNLKEGMLGFPKQRVIVMMQNFVAQSEGAPLNYDPDSRNSFVLLVMIIVLIMLLVTIAWVAVVLSTRSLKRFFLTYRTFILIGATIGQLACYYTIICSACGRRPPCSFVVLTMTTVFMSTLAALVSTYFRTSIVLYAAVATAAVVLVCTGLACTSFDFTKWVLFVVVIGVAFSVVSLIIIIVMMATGHYMKPVHIVILIIAVLLQSVSLVIELQMILGGRSIQLGEDDYALGAFMVYTSIVSIFIKLVQILGLLDMD